MLMLMYKVRCGGVHWKGGSMTEQEIPTYLPT